MSEFRTMILSELLTGIGGSIKTGPFGTMLKAHEYSNIGVPIISVGEVGYGLLRISESTPRAASDVVDRLPEYVLRHGDIVFGRKGAVDRSAWVNGDQDGWFLGSDGIRVRLAAGVDSRFMSYQFQAQTTRDWLLQHAAGTTMASLNGAILGRVPIVLPQLSEQRAIAEVLGALDDKIAANARLAHCLADLADSLFLRATSGPDLERAMLKELVTTQYGLTTSATGGTGPRFLRVTDINKNPWIEWATAPACEITEFEWEKYRTRPGDILVARMADPGKVAYIDDGAPDSVFASYLVRLVANDPSNSYLIYYFMRSVEYQEYAQGVSSGSVQRNMNAQVIINTEMPLPHPDALLRFNQDIQVIRRSLHSTLTESMKLAETRDTLLPAVMSGKLRVRDAEKQLEEVL